MSSFRNWPKIFVATKNEVRQHLTKVCQLGFIFCRIACNSTRNMLIFFKNCFSSLLLQFTWRFRKLFFKQKRRYACRVLRSSTDIDSPGTATLLVGITTASLALGIRGPGLIRGFSVAAETLIAILDSRVLVIFACAVLVAPKELKMKKEIRM